MAESYPSDEQLNGLSGATDSEQAVPYVPIGLSPYHTEFYQMQYRLLDVARRAGDCRVYKDDGGALKCGGRAGRYLNGDTPVNYVGASDQSLTDNTTNYIYLTADGTLTVNATGFPTPSATPHLPLATIATGTASAGGVAGQYAHEDITDYRGRAFLTVAGSAVGSVARGDIQMESLVRYPVALSSGFNLSGTAGYFHLSNSGWGGGLLQMSGNGAQGNTATDTYETEFALPAEYAAGEDVKLVVCAEYTGSGTVGATKSIDAEVYKMGDDGQPSADLNTTAAGTLTDAFADYTFTIDDSGLAAGDKLYVMIRTVLAETDGTYEVYAVIGGIEMQLDIRG